MIGTIAEKVQSLFSRSFFLGNFFPLVVVMALNLAVAWIGLPGGDVALGSLNTTEKLSAFAAVVAAGLTILAFILVPLIPLLRSILQGDWLPMTWRHDLIAHYRKLYDPLREDRDGCAERWMQLKLQVPVLIETLKAARTDPCARNTASTALDTAEQTLLNLQRQIRERARNGDGLARLPDQENITALVDEVAAALRNFPLSPAQRGYDPSTFQRLDQLHHECNICLRELIEVAKKAFQFAAGKCRQRFVDGDLRPTRLANTRAAMELYPELAYNAPFDFVWPRLRLVLPKDAAITTAVDTAAAQIDFAVLTTVLVATSTVAWLLILVFKGDTPLPFLVVGTFGPALVIFFYNLIDAAQHTFGEATASAIDCYRFDLLRALKMPLPATIVAERNLWNDLQLALYSAGDGNFFYRYPKT